MRPSSENDSKGQVPSQRNSSNDVFALNIGKCDLYQQRPSRSALGMVNMPRYNNSSTDKQEHRGANALNDSLMNDLLGENKKIFALYWQFKLGEKLSNKRYFQLISRLLVCKYELKLCLAWRYVYSTGNIDLWFKCFRCMHLIMDYSIL